MKISSTHKMIVLLILLIGSMYSWIDADRGLERIASMLALVIISYILGKLHGKIIGESNKNVQTN